MRIFLAGATGALGRRLTPLLVNAGHTVIGMTRSAGKEELLRSLGAEPVVADALDAESILAAMQQAEPEVVIHQLTAIPAQLDLNHFQRDFELTDRLRTLGTDYLVAAAQAVGARRFIAQSYCGSLYAPGGKHAKTEEDPINPHPPAPMRRTVEAIRHLEEAVTGAPALEGLALRYGWFYGPGTGVGPGGSILEAVRQHQMPVVGGGAGVWSWIHIDDAATATLAAVQRGAPGLYNVVDDEPAPVAEWLPALAEALGAKAPQRVPALVARLAIGELGVFMMTENQGASNAKAKRELGWEPKWKTWREGFRQGLE